jgi:hypothetical protein
MNKINNFFEAQITNVNDVSAKEATEVAINDIINITDQIERHVIVVRLEDYDLDMLYSQCEFLLIDTIHTIEQLTRAGVAIDKLYPPVDILLSLFERYEKKKEKLPYSS